MTFYEYKCQTCGHKFDKRMKRGEKKLPKCPKCQGKTKKLISLSEIQFKGSGFHKTDYKK